jgi:hypothetical protein
MKSSKLEATAYEYWLLEQYVCGQLVMGQVIELLKGRALLGSRAVRAGFSLSGFLRLAGQHTLSHSKQVGSDPGGGAQHLGLSGAGDTIARAAGL